ncbi:DnaJ domain-containing protein [Pseudomonas pohangensis]|uniref:DnaJ domain-containing protein n=1 Tax=Pseudomonas pohangensis TaxID=364197 RepID=A0A1H2ESA9_9PSED|nr:J domain-containing protein [Pseudomonas pohangensis]SDT97997.1 DnaJ domain-containing protein [Pseudomonas pohangensis]
MRTHYDNLHIAETASIEVVKAAYKALAQKWHPDKHPDQREKAERYFNIICRAFEVISDPVQRRKYDAYLVKQRSEKDDDSAPEPVKEPPPMTPAQRASEAFQDGKRSREQGFSAFGCPYQDEILAGAWQRGYQSAAPGKQEPQSQPVSAKSNLLERLWRGEAGLTKTFFLYGVVGFVVVFVISMLVATLFASDSKDIGRIIRTAQLFYLPYLVFILICNFRALVRAMSGKKIDSGK